MTLKVKISRNGHFIDDSNKYRFIYVPRNISTEKKKIFHERFSFNFFPAKRRGQQCCIFPCTVTTAVRFE